MEKNKQNSVLLCRDSLALCTSLRSLQVPSSSDAYHRTTVWQVLFASLSTSHRTVLSQICCMNSTTPGISHQQEAGHAVSVKSFHCVYVHVFCIWEGL